MTSTSRRRSEIDADPARPACPTRPVGPAANRSLFTTAVRLYYHLSRETLDAILAGEPFAGAGVVRVEDIGPVIPDQVRQWLGHANVVLKPVINLPGIQPVDHYESPPRCPKPSG